MNSSRLTSEDLHLFNEGTHYRLYDKLGAHPCVKGGQAGTQFAVWAPNAEHVSVIGDWNHWDREHDKLQPRDSSGIWEGFVAGVSAGAHYKLHVRGKPAGQQPGTRVDKADPCGFHHEIPPHNASVVWPLDYEWSDQSWLKERAQRQALDAPLSIYEVHLGSFMRVPEENHRMLSYRELAPKLCAHVQELGFTHVELLPIMEHPFAGSWGYQVTGYYAPTSRFGTPQDFMWFVDYLHQHGIGVILDWVPAHFPTDAHGLGDFDGTHLYEHADPRLGFHPDWKSYIFNYGRNEVRAFLISSALMWLDKYHIDGLRVDGVASMLYRDYSRAPGEWLPNQHGGRENLEAVSFLQQLNRAVYEAHPDVQTIAEESTAWPMVSRPTYLGGLGFGLKWDLGFMHDALGYMSRVPIHRKFHHNELTFRSLYAFQENFVLPFSHDEVVHGKGSLLRKMPGDEWQRFANLRLLLAYQYAQPGKKLLFMGCEFGQEREWNHDASLDWHLAKLPLHGGVQALVRDLNLLHRDEPAMHERDTDGGGFSWIEANDTEQSILVFARSGKRDSDVMVAAFNFTPVARDDYRIGVPLPGAWTERLNTDAEIYGGSNRGNLGRVIAQPTPLGQHKATLKFSLPPLGAVFLKSPR